MIYTWKLLQRYYDAYWALCEWLREHLDDVSDPSYCLRGIVYYSSLWKRFTGADIFYFGDSPRVRELLRSVGLE